MSTLWGCGRLSQCVEHLSLLHAGVKRLPKHKGVQPRPQLLGQGHNDVEVSLHVQVQVRLQGAQGFKWLLPLLPVRRWRRWGGREAEERKWREGRRLHVTLTDEWSAGGAAGIFYSFPSFFFFCCIRISLRATAPQKATATWIMHVAAAAKMKTEHKQSCQATCKVARPETSGAGGAGNTGKQK